MPCYTPPPTAEEMNAHGDMTQGQFEAVLCGVFTAIEREGATIDECLGDLDWTEIGVDPDLVQKWWALHKARDAEKAR